MLELTGNTIDWGITPYEDAFNRQKEYLQEHLSGDRADTLILTEHHPVYTLGARQGAAQNLLWDDAQLTSKGIATTTTNRGGDITYHGPGQLIAYPIISLQKSRDLHAYLRDLEQVIINTIGTLGLAGARRPGKTGIWLQDRKIAALGIAVKQWVTYHGFSLNVNTDLTPFTGIIPCGISSEEGTVTSMQQELQAEQKLDTVKKIVADEFWKQFS